MSAKRVSSNSTESGELAGKVTGSSGSHMQGTWRRLTKDRMLRAYLVAIALFGVLVLEGLIRGGTGTPLVYLPWVVTTGNAFIGLICVSVALLALGRWKVLRDSSSFWVSVAFSALGLGQIFNLLTFPGLLPGGAQILGSLPNTSAWLAAVFYMVFGITLLAAALLDWPRERDTRGGRYDWLVPIWILFMTAAYSLIVVFEQHMPLMLTVDGRFTPLANLMVGVVFGIEMIAATAITIWRYLKSGNTFLGYLALLEITQIETAVLALVWSVRFDYWWYALRITATAGFLVMFFGLLSEYIDLFRLEREKTAALRESEERLKATFDNAALGIIEVDADGRITMVNRRICEMLGYRREELLATNVHDLTYPTDRELSDQINADVNAGRRDPVDYRKRYTRKDGSPVWVHVTVSAIRDTDGRFVRAVGTVEDITEVKRAEEREKELELRQLEFYRRTILAVTGRKLCITDREDLLEIIGEPAAEWEFRDTAGLAALRHKVADMARSAGMDRDDINRLLTCVGESTSNALKHSEKAVASVHRKDGAFIFAVSDTGTGIQELSLPDVALVMGYTTTGTGGMGYKLMLASADQVYLATGPDGTIVACKFSRFPMQST